MSDIFSLFASADKQTSNLIETESELRQFTCSYVQFEFTMLKLVFFGVIVGIGAGQSFWEFDSKLERCPDFEPQKDFNLTAFLGTWYEIERYPNPFEMLASCVVTDYIVTNVDEKGHFNGRF